MRWLRTRAGELGVDAGRIVAWGESAGGHLAALLGVNRFDTAAHLARWGRIHFVVNHDRCH